MKSIITKIIRTSYIIIATILISSCTPNPKEILKRSFDKCQSIENGYYEMNYLIKYMNGKDSSSSSYNCYFKKLVDDSIFSSAFHLQQYYNGKYSCDVMYTGNGFVTYWVEDRVGEILSKELWANDIKSRSNKYKYYSPIFNKQSYPLPNESDYSDDKSNFQFIGEEIINELPCYHVKMNTKPLIDSAEITKVIDIEKNYWINKLDFIPIQYTITVTLEEFNDTIYEYVRYVLEKYELNQLKDDAPFKLSSVPSYVKLNDYVPYETPDLLPNDTIAPNWSLLSLKDELISLYDLKGKLVLLDFFYKNCQPCILALPGLQSLHEKYEDKGLRIIGINPYDTKEKDDIENYLAKCGVTYTILLGGEEVAKEYKLYGYPTIYLIDRNGKIISTKVGYSDQTEEKLEEIIKEHL